jgi:hypothetical protein
MLEGKKNREAQFFYALALDEERKVNDDTDRFGYFLSAFLSAARSGGLDVLVGSKHGPPALRSFLRKVLRIKRRPLQRQRQIQKRVSSG